MLKILALILTFLFFLFLQKYIAFNKNWRNKNLLINTSMGLLSFFTVSAWLYLIPLKTLFEKGILHTANLPNWVLILLTLLLLDLVSYLWHMANHHIAILWRFHRCHHSEIEMESSTAFKFHFIETNLSLVPRFAVVIILGLPAAGLLYFEVIYQFFNVYQHSNIRLPSLLEKYLNILFVTPAFHRKHHSIIHKEQQSNLSTIFNFWDRMGRTFVSNSKDESFALGLGDNKKYGLKELLLLPFKSL